jgi:diketogulonate reductase-like aldo/keto reductase
VASGVPRSEIFITSKLDPSGYDKALEDFDVILESLQTDYIDLLLIHWPGKINEKPGQLTWAECRIQTWRALETIFKQKRVRLLFLSFYTNLSSSEIIYFSLL